MNQKPPDTKYGRLSKTLKANRVENRGTGPAPASALSFHPGRDRYETAVLLEIRWQVWYRDKFDRECPSKVEDEGSGAVSGLESLWLRSLAEGIVLGTRGRGHGLEPVSIATESFSEFWLQWAIDGAPLRIPIERDECPANQALFKLRQWIFETSPSDMTADSNADDRSLSRLRALAMGHLSRLQGGLDSTAATGEFIKWLSSLSDFSVLEDSLK